MSYLYVLNINCLIMYRISKYSFILSKWPDTSSILLIGKGGLLEPQNARRETRLSPSLRYWLGVLSDP